MCESQGYLTAEKPACANCRERYESRINLLRADNSDLGSEVANLIDANDRLKADLKRANEALETLIDSMPNEVCIPASVAIYLNQKA